MNLINFHLLTITIELPAVIKGITLVRNKMRRRSVTEPDGRQVSSTMLRLIFNRFYI